MKISQKREARAIRATLTVIALLVELSSLGMEISPKQASVDMIEAIGAKDYARLTKALEQGADPNSTDPTGETALGLVLRAANSPEDILMAQALLNHGAQVTGKLIERIIPRINFLFASPAGVRLFQQIVTKAGNLFFYNDLGETPLHSVMGIASMLPLAPEKIRLAINILIRAGVPVNAQTKKNPYNSRASAGETILNLIAQRLEQLVTKARWPEDFKPIMLLILMQELLDYGADPRIPNERGETPLRRLEEAIKLALQRGLNTDQLENMRELLRARINQLNEGEQLLRLRVTPGQTPTLYTQLLPRELTEQLITYRAGGPHALELARHTAELINAVQQGDYQAAEKALRAGADADATTPEGISLLEAAVLQKDPKQAERWASLLVRYARNPNPVIAAQGQTLLEAITSRGNRWRRVAQIIRDALLKQHAHALAPPSSPEHGLLSALQFSTK
jgi:ankyrin repeat protein